jgi:hypothetical protein
MPAAASCPEPSETQQTASTYPSSRLSATEALHGLVEADSLFGNPLDSARVAEQLNWINRMKAYRWIYEDLEEAIQTVNKLVGMQVPVIPA